MGFGRVNTLDRFCQTAEEKAQARSANLKHHGFRRSCLIYLLESLIENPFEEHAQNVFQGGVRME
jgi:hypothetical protein